MIRFPFGINSHSDQAEQRRRHPDDYEQCTPLLAVHARVDTLRGILLSAAARKFSCPYSVPATTTTGRTTSSLHPYTNTGVPLSTIFGNSREANMGIRIHPWLAG